jgi:hypothetical protein
MNPQQPPGPRDDSTDVKSFLSYSSGLSDSVFLNLCKSHARLATPSSPPAPAPPPLIDIEIVSNHNHICFISTLICYVTQFRPNGLPIMIGKKRHLRNTIASQQLTSPKPMPLLARIDQPNTNPNRIPLKFQSDNYPNISGI